MSDDIQKAFGVQFKQAYYRGDNYYLNPDLPPLPKREGVTVEQITAVPFGPATTRDAAIYHAQSVNDAGNHKFIAGVYVRGNDVKAQIWLVDQHQTILRYWEVRPQNGPQAAHKWDSFKILISGSNLECWGSSHEAFSGERDNCIMFAVLVGVVPTPYPAGFIQEGAPFDMTTFGGGGAPDPTGPSADEIATATLGKITGELSDTNSALYQKMAALVGNTVHHAVQSEANSDTGVLHGLAHVSDLTNINLHDGHTVIADSLYSRFDDSLSEHGLPKKG